MFRKINFIIILIIGITLHAKNAIIIGASSGMGRELAKCLSADGYTVGLVARRLPLLKSLQEELQTLSYIKQIDVTSPNARDQLSEFIEEMGGIDLIVISISPALDVKNAMAANGQRYTWAEKATLLDVCARGFIALADVAFDHFIQQNSGHLVGISSTSALRGSSYSPEYCASKACISMYMEGMRNSLVQQNINVCVSDVIAGYVEVEYAPKGTDPNAYWEISVQEAGKTIMEGVKKKKKIIYVPKYKGWIVAFLLRNLPDYIYNHYVPWL